jgi:hypothetical protein
MGPKGEEEGKVKEDEKWCQCAKKGWRKESEYAHAHIQMGIVPYWHIGKDGNWRGGDKVNFFWLIYVKWVFVKNIYNDIYGIAMPNGGRIGSF